VNFKFVATFQQNLHIIYIYLSLQGIQSL